MRYLFLTLAFLTSILCLSQDEQVRYNKVASEFHSRYNESNYGAVHQMFDDVMQKLLSKDETIHLLNTVRSNFGLIKKIEFSKVNNSAHVYRTTFNKGVADISISLNEENEIIAFFIPRNVVENSSKLERNSTKMIFPFKEETFIFWGGETEDINYHMADLNQQYAFDILMVANGAPYKGDPKKNESYFIFGKDIIAPCDAKVVKIVDGIDDNIPGSVNKTNISGNIIVLETRRKEYLLFAHIKKHTILYKEGDFVKQGQVIAQCGNSGNSTQAHLHFQLQNTDNLFNTVGAKIYFDDVIVNGKLKSDYMPKKEDFIKNKKNIK